jgi:hypothetical protein
MRIIKKGLEYLLFLSNEVDYTVIGHFPMTRNPVLQAKHGSRKWYDAKRLLKGQTGLFSPSSLA